MKPMNQLLCAAALMLIVATPASYADAQTATGRALFAYPMKGQTPDQENLDRAACHDWAVAQSGFDPEPVFAAQQAGISTKYIVTSGTRGACVPMNTPVTRKVELAEPAETPRSAASMRSTTPTSELDRFA
jgi:hypothetical protein